MHLNLTLYLLRKNAQYILVSVWGPSLVLWMFSILFPSLLLIKFLLPLLFCYFPCKRDTTPFILWYNLADLVKGFFLLLWFWLSSSFSAYNLLKSLIDILINVPVCVYRAILHRTHIHVQMQIDINSLKISHRTMLAEIFYDFLRHVKAIS